MKGDEDSSRLHVFLRRVCCVSGVLGGVVQFAGEIYLLACP